jgi:capsular exopolysaccharide synthesis family protein
MNIIQLYRNENQMINDAIDRIVVEVYRRKRENSYQTFLMVGSSPLAGTTTNAINLAIALSMAGWKTVLVDCDLRKKSQYKRLNTDVVTGLSDYLNETEKDRESVSLSDVTYATNYSLLDFIPSGSINVMAIRLLCSSRMEKCVEELKNKYDYVIFDFPSINIVSDAEVLMPIVDGIMLVAALKETTKRQLSESKKKVKFYGDKYMGLIINKVDILQYRTHMRDYDYFKQSIQSKMFKKKMKDIKIDTKFVTKKSNNSKK